MRLTTCSACQMGDHKRHVKRVEKVPDGMLGGSICPCKGECKGKNTPESFLRRAGMGFLIDPSLLAQGGASNAGRLPVSAPTHWLMEGEG
jgi:hypothetical protein